MIDDISEPGAWARELAMQPKMCRHCRHYRAEIFLRNIEEYCALNHPLQPCADYEREVGADDERGEHEQL